MIKEFIKKHGIENVRFLVPMNKLEGYFLGIFPSYSHKEQEIKECVITEDPKETRYKVKDNYKITLKSIDDGRTEHFYISDLESLINRNKIIKMEVKPAFLN